MTSKNDIAEFTGIGMGCALAMILSWTKNMSILYAIVHGLCSWLYVIWYWLYVPY